MSNLTNLIEEIQSALLPYLAKEQGGEIWYHCPFHEDEEASMHVNYDRGIWYCFAPECRLRFEGQWTLKGLAQGLRDVGLLPPKEQSFPEIATVSNLFELVQYWHIELLKRPELLTYLQTNRALSMEIIKAAMLGYHHYSNCHFLTIPIFTPDGKIDAVKVRRLKLNDDGSFEFSKEKPRYFFLKSKHHPLIPDTRSVRFYPLHIYAARPSYEVWIVGGELDALAAWSAGKCALAAILSETELEGIGEYIQGKHVVLCLDNEPSVNKVKPHLAQYLSNYAFAVSIVPESCFLPEAKDFTEMAVLRRIDMLVPQPFRSETAPSDTVVFVDEKGYYVYDQTQHAGAVKRYILYGGHIHPRHFIIDIDRQQEVGTSDDFYGEYWFDIEFTMNKTPRRISVRLSGDVIGDVNKLRSALLRLCGINVVVGKTTYNELISLFHSLKFKPLLVTNRVGLHIFSDGNIAFIYPNFVYPPDTDCRYLDRIGDETLRDIIAPISDDEFAFICKNLLYIHEEPVVIRLLAMLHAIALAPFVRSVCNNVFPVFFICGNRGTGKTTLVNRVINRLLGMNEQIFVAPQQTESTLRKYAYMRLSVPLILDEFTPRRYDAKILQNAKTLIHRCYDRAIAQVSKSAEELAAGFPANAPLVLIGEEDEWIIKDAALAERIYIITFPKSPNRDQQEVWKVLEKHIKNFGGYAERLIKFLYANRDKWQEWFDLATEIVFHLASRIHPPITYRVRLMWVVVAFGLIIWRQFWQEHGIDGFITQRSLNSLIESLIPVNVEGLSADPFLALLRDINDLKHASLNFDDNAAKVVTHKNKQYLAINPHNIPKLMLDHKYTRWQHLTSETIRSYARLLRKTGAGEFIADTNVAVKLSGKTVKCILIDMVKLYQTTGILLDGFMSEEEIAQVTVFEETEESGMIDTEAFVDSLGEETSEEMEFPF